MASNKREREEGDAKNAPCTIGANDEEDDDEDDDDEDYDPNKDADEAAELAADLAAEAAGKRKGDTAAVLGDKIKRKRNTLDVHGRQLLRSAVFCSLPALLPHPDTCHI